MWYTLGYFAAYMGLILCHHSACWSSSTQWCNWSLTRYVKLRVAHAPGMAGKQSRHVSRHVRKVSGKWPMASACTVLSYSVIRVLQYTTFELDWIIIFSGWRHSKWSTRSRDIFRYFSYQTQWWLWSHGWVVLFETCWSNNIKHQK